MKKYYCDLCSQEFTRRWNMDRHKHLSHVSQSTLPYRQFQFGSQGMPNYPSNYSTKHSKSYTSELDEAIDQMSKISILTELHSINSNLVIIKTILSAIFSQLSHPS